jgi:hypothetical protein
LPHGQRFNYDGHIHVDPDVQSHADIHVDPDVHFYCHRCELYQARVLL